MKLIRRAALVLVTVAAIALAGSSNALATKSDKVYVCHATSSEFNPYVTLYVPATETGYPQGHFTENGTQEAGHEEDYLGQCQSNPTPSPTSSATPVPPPPTPSPTPEPSESPSATPSPAPSTEPSPSTVPSPSTPVSTSSPAPLPTPPATDTEEYVPLADRSAESLVEELLVGAFILALSYFLLRPTPKSR